MLIREAQDSDFPAIWSIFKEVVSTGDTYPYLPDMTEAEAYNLWMSQPHQTFVAEEDGPIYGTYVIKQNHPGLGSHVCNCGYMVASTARGRGIATAMCHHSQKTALALGYKAIQFNLVVATNEGAVHLWQKLGFEIIGRLPQAFNHHQHGYVDAFVMYKWLGG